MVTTRLTLTFPDGVSAWAGMETECAVETGPITYGGDIARLLPLPPDGQPVTLRLIWKQLAEKHRATLAVRQRGLWRDESDIIGV